MNDNNKKEIQEDGLFKELDSMDEFDLLDLLETANSEITDHRELTLEEEKAIEIYEQRLYKQAQKEMDDEFEDNLNVETFELAEREEYDPTNPKYYL